MIFCENRASQSSVKDVVAIIFMAAGLNVLLTRTTPRNAIDGTSLASRGSHKIFDNAELVIIFSRDKPPQCYTRPDQG